jgi:hypothetical protein
MGLLLILGICIVGFIISMIVGKIIYDSAIAYPLLVGIFGTLCFCLMLLIGMFAIDLSLNGNKLIETYKNGEYVLEIAQEKEVRSELKAMAGTALLEVNSLLKKYKKHDNFFEGIFMNREVLELEPLEVELLFKE